MFLVNPPQIPCKGSLLLAHGSGASGRSPFMEGAAQALAEAGLEVTRFDFGFIEPRRPPDRFPKLQQEYLEIFRQWEAPPPRFVGGKSLGSRVSLSCLQDLPVAGGLALGYPFHPPGQLQKTRLEWFQGLTKPFLLLQGTRDPFGGPTEVAGYGLPACVELHWFEGEAHDLKSMDRITALTRAWLQANEVFWT